MTIFKTVALSTSVICASLFLGDVNAIPVPIVNNAGVQVGMLQDNDNRITDIGYGQLCYYSTKDGRIVNVDKDAYEGAPLYFSLSDGNYVQADFLENEEIKEKFGEHIGNLPSRISKTVSNLELCVMLHIETWKSDIETLRGKGWLNDRKEIIRNGFNSLKRVSAKNGKELIEAVKTNLLKIEKEGNLTIQQIADQYRMLNLCFANDKSNGIASNAINYLLLEDTDNLPPEDKAIADKMRDYFLHHIPKHFSHPELMDRPKREFNGIDSPENGSPYTSLSYGLNRYGDADAKAITERVYQHIVQELTKRCNFYFDINESNRSFTIRMKQKTHGRSVESKYGLDGMCKLTKKELKKICMDGNVSPNIYNISKYDDGGRVAPLNNMFFYLFFNLGASFKNDLSINGSLFPVAYN